MELYAFPDIGVPPYSAIGPQLDRCIVYSIVRTESGFDQRDMSSAKAVGLMQVTPEAGATPPSGSASPTIGTGLCPIRSTIRRWAPPKSPPCFKDYRGSYIMTFAGYNAGRGRVQQWVAQHGDPRDPKVDAVDWVERIPFAETRNYVQRVMENLQVYRARFGDSTATVEPNLHRAATSGRAPSSACGGCSLGRPVANPEWATTACVCLLGGARGEATLKTFRPRAVTELSRPLRVPEYQHCLR